jgi:hypothetical protein
MTFFTTPIIKAVKDFPDEIHPVSKEKRAKDNATVMIVEVAEEYAAGEKANIFEKTARIRMPDDIDEDDDDL